MAAGGGFAAYSYFIKVPEQLDSTRLMIMGDPNASISSADCDKSHEKILADHPGVTSFDDNAFQNACTWKTRTYYGYIIGGVGLLGAVTSLIMLSRDTEPSEKPATGARGKKPDVAIVPIWTPDVGGASLSVRW
jgi:hypothetical protein